MIKMNSWKRISCVWTKISKHTPVFTGPVKKRVVKCIWSTDTVKVQNKNSRYQKCLETIQISQVKDQKQLKFQIKPLITVPGGRTAIYGGLCWTPSKWSATDNSPDGRTDTHGGLWGSPNWQTFRHNWHWRGWHAILKRIMHVVKLFLRLYLAILPTIAGLGGYPIQCGHCVDFVAMLCIRILNSGEEEVRDVLVARCD